MKLGVYSLKTNICFMHNQSKNLNDISNFGNERITTQKGTLLTLIRTHIIEYNKEVLVYNKEVLVLEFLRGNSIVYYAIYLDRSETLKEIYERIV